jgi:hypothetical protein
MVLAPGVEVGPFILERHLGGGAQGQVWLVHRRGFEERRLALKIISGSFEVQELLRREASLVAGFHHPNIVDIIEIGAIPGTLWLAQEYVPGEDLRQLLDRSPRLPVSLALYIAGEVLKALQAAHTQERPIIHRDIKPGNILIGRDGQVQVTDFGIARRVEDPQSTVLRGTVGYLAPEVLRGADPSVASDLFAAGVVLWEMLSGRRLFQGKTLEETILLTAAAKVPALPEEIPGPVSRIAMRLLRARPEDRFPGALRAVEAIRALPEGKQASSVEMAQFLAGESAAEMHLVQAPTELAIPVQANASSRRRWLPAALVGFAVLALAGGALLLAKRMGHGNVPGTGTLPADAAVGHIAAEQAIDGGVTTVAPVLDASVGSPGADASTTDAVVRTEKPPVRVKPPVVSKNSCPLRIVGVQAGSPAWNAGLYVGDVILRVNGSPMLGPADRGFVTGQVQSSDGQPVMFQVRHGRTERSVSILAEKRGARWTIGIDMNTDCL